MIQLHPVDSYDKKLNFWEEFPAFKTHAIFSEFWTINKKAGKLKESSEFMWVLTLCYDRKSSSFNQPEVDKWEVSCENVWDDGEVFLRLLDDPTDDSKVIIPMGGGLRTLISAFEGAIDTPLGVSLRMLERKLADRTDFMMRTPYTMDAYEKRGEKNILVKGTADQLDRMFTGTQKIVSLIQEAMDKLKASEGSGGHLKGGGKASLSDSDSDF